MPGLYDHLRRLEAKSYAVGPATYSSAGRGSGGLLRWPNVAGYDYSRHSLEANSVIGVALDWIGDNVHKGRIVVGREEEDGTYTEARGHPLTDRRPDGRPGLLRQPNPFMSWEDTLRSTVACLCLRGEAYWLKARNGLGEVDEVYWVPNAQVEVVPEVDWRVRRQSGPIRAFRFTDWPVTRDYAPRDVVFFRDLVDLACPYRGTSRLWKQIRNVAAVDHGERALDAFLRNLHGGLIISPKESGVQLQEGGADEPEMLALKGKIERGTSGENLDRVIPTSLPIDAQKIGMSPDELGLDRILQDPRSMILAALGLNGVVVGIPSADQATYANKAESRKDAWDNGVIPKQDRIAQAIQAQLLVDFDVAGVTDVWWNRDDVEALVEDADKRVARAVAMRGGPIASEDEARALANLPPGEPGSGGDLTPVQEAAAGREAAEQIAAGRGPDHRNANGRADGRLIKALLARGYSDEGAIKAARRIRKKRAAARDGESEGGPPARKPKGVGTVRRKAGVACSATASGRGNPCHAEATGHFAGRGGPGGGGPDAPSSAAAAGGKLPPPTPRTPSRGSSVGEPEHLHAAEREQQIAGALGGRSVGRRNGKDLPMDVLVRVGGRRHGVEVKTLSKGNKRNVSMHADAMLRKAEYASRREGRTAHLVAVDDRAEYGGGAFGASHSGHQLYYKRGVGAFSLASMHKVKDLDELKTLIRAKDADLPEAARAPAGWPPRGRALAKLRAQAEGDHAGRLERQRRARAEGRGWKPKPKPKPKEQAA